MAVWHITTHFVVEGHIFLIFLTFIHTVPLGRCALLTPHCWQFLASLLRPLAKDLSLFLDPLSGTHYHDPSEKNSVSQLLKENLRLIFFTSICAEVQVLVSVCITQEVFVCACVCVCAHVHMCERVSVCLSVCRHLYGWGKTLIHNKKKAIFHCKTEGYNPNQDALHQLTRHQQTIIFRLRTGHCRLNSHLKRIGVKTSAQCPCGEADQTPEHYLQSCSLHQQARQQIWPTCVSLKTKLWGSAEDLLLTSRYAALAGERI